jgi:hypothetical protein
LTGGYRYQAPKTRYAMRRHEEWFREGKKFHSVGFLRTSVVLYSESDGDNAQIMNVFGEDVGRNVCVVIIVGTVYAPQSRFCKTLQFER